MALVKPMEDKLIGVRKKLDKEFKNPKATAAQKRVLKRDIRALDRIIAAMESARTLTNHNVC